MSTAFICLNPLHEIKPRFFSHIEKVCPKCGKEVFKIEATQLKGKLHIVSIKGTPFQKLETGELAEI